MKLSGIIFAGALLGLGVLVACESEFTESLPGHTLSAARAGQSEVDFAKETLERLQAISFAKNREFCGYIARGTDGRLVATSAQRGRIDSCRAFGPPEGYELVASYHTHGAFDYDVPAEFPSASDVEADHDEGVNGYISTPGGRFWFVDGAARVVHQICGTGCLPQDPEFQSGLDGEIAQRYTLEELRAFEWN